MTNWTFKHLREILLWKQEYFGMLFGMGKQAVSRFERGKRKETLLQKETLSLVAFLDERNLLNEYVQWRFGFKISNRFYKNGIPMDDQKYINI